ncbi:MAG: acyl-CoA dehydrogenase family protein [Pseudomonadota bacterium]
MADFTLDDDQRQIQDMTRKFAEKEFRAQSRNCDESGELPPELMEKAWELGFCPNIVPEEYGGYGLDRSVVTSAIMFEELAWGDASLALGALSPLLMMVPILEFGSPDQKSEWLPKFCGEKFPAATSALMEPGISFSPSRLRTTVETKGGDLVLNGKKCLVPLADQAEAILVLAAGPSGVEAVLVDRDAPGLLVGEREKNMGLRALPLFPIELRDCRVPASRLLGQGSGIDYQRLIDLSRASLCALAVGTARASLEYALEYAKERKAFGEPIASRQSIAFMLAEAAMEVDAMRLMTWRAAWRLDRGGAALEETALAKMYCGEQVMKVTDYGVQILGGHGYIREHPVEMWFRNGRAFSMLEGLAIS